jgi:hypothetical protein
LPSSHANRPLIPGPWLIAKRRLSWLCEAAYRTMLRINGRALHRVRNTRRLRLTTFSPP